MDLADPLQYTSRWRVRQYELDSNGHVNNAVYLNWAEEIAGLHAEAAGYGRQWVTERGGAWVVHKAEITWRRPALRGDEVSVTVRVESLKGARGIRRTWIRRAADSELLCEILTEWAWIRAADGRPQMIPKELVELIRQAGEA
ncbi:MAG: thioesterase family protein [Candidatus Dormibacteraceae bacterium]